jgi:serine/threonine-protein kinase
MRQNSFNEACPKLEESERIDPAVGTLLYLGECYERAGKTASAWATFREAASLASNSNQVDRARIAASRAQDLEPKLSRLSVEVAPEVMRLSGVVVKRSGQRLEPSLYGTPLPVDPGEYRIEVSAPGYETWSAPIKVDSGGASASVRVPALIKGLEPPHEPVTTAGAPGAPGGTETAPMTPAVVANSSLSTQQTLGIVVGGVGLIGVGLGSYFGIRAISRNSEAEQQCPNPGLCNNERGLTLTNQAKQNASGSNIAFAAGGALVAVGAVLYLTGGRRSSERVSLVPLLAPGTATASISGRF